MHHTGFEAIETASRDEIESLQLSRLQATLYRVYAHVPFTRAKWDAAGVHPWEDHFLAEVIDPATGVVLPEGALGELVLTSLTKEAVPVVRYRTRDLTRLLAGTARRMWRMERVLGRTDDMMILRGVNVYPSQIEEQVLGVGGVSGHFQIELTRVGRMDAMAVLAESADAGREALGMVLARRIKQALGITVSVRIGVPGSVARSAGKAVRVVDVRG